MKIGPDGNSTSLRRRWGVPLGVATGVTAVSLTAVAVLGGVGDASPTAPDVTEGAPAGTPTSTASTGPTTTDDQKDFTVTSTRTTPIPAGTVARILSSCLGASAAQYDPVIALRAPAASPTADGVVLAVDSAGQYVQCATKGDRGTSLAHPPTFINNRLWGTGRTIAYFDSTFERGDNEQFVAVGAGHYTAQVAKVTVSFGDSPQEYPARMSDGAFAYATALTPDTPPGPRYMGPNPSVHAYDASGKEIYNQLEDPTFTGDG
ncbi:hypothetical protein [Streptomyces sp. SID5785]|uniref:hypothetical protein n=1 Tax=Streptomyces sp. SID5785 TaxID=2690309 RepID=UPI00136AA059|nr:hypothetical protein [Streptomyces sp. SID5785]